MIAGIALCLLIGYAFSWVFAFIGLTASSPEAANAYGFTILFPLTFVSSAFVPVASMPGWLQPIAEHNPFTYMVNAVRALFLGIPVGNDVWLALALDARDHRRLRAALGVALPTSRRAVIRPLTADDAGELAALLVENRAFLAPFEPDRGERFYTVEGQLERLEREDKHAFAILDGEQIAGTVTLSNVVRGATQSANLGYWVAAKAQRPRRSRRRQSAS